MEILDLIIKISVAIVVTTFASWILFTFGSFIWDEIKERLRK